MLSCLMSRPVPLALSRLLGNRAGRVPVIRGASARELSWREIAAVPAGREVLQFPDAAARGRQKPGLRSRAAEDSVACLHQRHVASRGRCEHESWAPGKAAGLRGGLDSQELGMVSRGSRGSPPLGATLGARRFPSLVVTSEGGWLPKLPRPEEPLSRDAKAPPLSTEPSRLRLWPNPEHSGHHRSRGSRSRRVKVPNFAAATAVAAGLALCYSKSHLSKGDDEGRPPGRGGAGRGCSTSLPLSHVVPGVKDTLPKEVDVFGWERASFGQQAPNPGSWAGSGTCQSPPRCVQQ